MDVIARECRYVTGRTVANGGAGDSSVLTALGVFQGMRAAAEHAWGTPSLAGRVVGVEGVGKVGRRLVGHLIADGAQRGHLRHQRRGRGPGPAPAPGGHGRAPSRADLLASQLDVYSPCALGGSVDDDTVAALGARAGDAKIICGGANNQLAHPGVQKLLADCGIIYAPDYVVNAGGVIQVADELTRVQLRARQGPGRADLRHYPAAFADRGGRGRAAGGRRRPAGRAADGRRRPAPGHLPERLMQAC